MRIFNRRNNNGSNTTEANALTQSGWLPVTNAATGSLTANVTFPTAYTTLPVIVASVGGDNASSSTYGSGVIALAGGVMVEVYSITTSGFSVYLRKQDGTNFATGFTFVQWIAIGV